MVYELHAVYTKTSGELKRNQIGIKEQRQSRCTINTFAEAIYSTQWCDPLPLLLGLVVLMMLLLWAEPEQEHATTTTTTTTMSMMNETTRRKLKYSSPIHSTYQRDENEKGFNRSIRMYSLVAQWALFQYNVSRISWLNKMISDFVKLNRRKIFWSAMFFLLFIIIASHTVARSLSLSLSLFLSSSFIRSSL